MKIAAQVLLLINQSHTRYSINSCNISYSICQEYQPPTEYTQIHSTKLSQLVLACMLLLSGLLVPKRYYSCTLLVRLPVQHPFPVLSSSLLIFCFLNLFCFPGQGSLEINFKHPRNIRSTSQSSFHRSQGTAGTPK